MNKKTRDVMFSSEDMNAVTPQDFFDQLNEEFKFTLDAAASAENTKCKVYFDEQTNALVQPWRGKNHRIWINPPYGRGIGAWVDKAVEEAADYREDCLVCMLLPARTDTRWFQTIAESVDEIRFVRGRLKFSNKDAAPFPSMVAIWYGDYPIRFVSPPDGPYNWNLIWKA